jgi:hypothetical protein
MFGSSPLRYRNVSQTSDRVVSVSPRAENRRDEVITGGRSVTTWPAFAIRLEKIKIFKQIEISETSELFERASTNKYRLITQKPSRQSCA